MSLVTAAIRMVALFSGGRGMKILLVTMQLGRGYGQGTERYVTTLGECLARGGHEVGYLAGDPLHLRGDKRVGQALSVEEAGSVGGTIYHHPTTGWMTVAGPTSDRADGQALRAWLEDWCPDVLHVANPAHIGTAVMDAARSVGIPVVVTTMDFWWLCPKATLLRHDHSVCDATPGWGECLQCISRSHPRGVTRILGRLPSALMHAVLGIYYAKNCSRGLSRRDMALWPRRRDFLLQALGQADHVVFPSDATRAALQASIAPERSSVIPYGLPPQWFRQHQPPPPGPLEPAALTLGYAGALLPHKGVHVLIEAVRQLQWTQTRVRVAGPSNNPIYLEHLRKSGAGLNLEFTGALPVERMPDFLASLDVLILPSLWPENLPFAMLEAHAAGVPVIASRLSGVEEQIGNEALLFEPGAAADLARALEGFRRSPLTARPRRVQTAEEMADRTLAVYERILHPNANRRS